MLTGLCYRETYHNLDSFIGEYWQFHACVLCTFANSGITYLVLSGRILGIHAFQLLGFL